MLCSNHSRWSVLIRVLPKTDHITQNTLENDWDIPYSHSQVLFDAFLSPILPQVPSLPENPLSQADWQTYTDQTSLHSQKRDQLVSTTQVTGYGTLEQAQVQGRNVALLLTEAGGHDIGRVEGVQETIGRMFGFY